MRRKVFAMKAQLFHIFGPFSVHSYGVCIALGVLLFVFLVRRNPVYRTYDLDDHFSVIIIIGSFFGLLGGRLLHLISNGESLLNISEWFSFWQGGLAILGAIIGIIVSVTLYLVAKKIPVLPFFDLMAIYSPLLQSVSRVGCFLAGCCYGMHTTSWIGVTYTDTMSLAPLHYPLHPTQLYSSAALLLIFILMYGVLQHIFKKPGQLLFWYLILESSERFFIDFLRADRIMVNTFLSYHQIIALGLFGIGIFLLCITVFQDSRFSNTL